MGFDSKIYGSFGDEKKAQSSKIGDLPLGARMELPDGRIFVHAKASATSLVAGKLYQGKAYEASSTFIRNLVLADGAVGDKTVTITVAGTALLYNVYEDGYLTLHTGTGVGSTYKVKGNAQCTSSTCTVTLEPSDPLVTAIQSGTTTGGMRKNEFDEVTLTTADTVGVNLLAGVPNADVSANYYCWLQRRGSCLCLEDDSTLIVGLPVTASTVTAGAVGLHAKMVAHATGIDSSSPIAGAREELAPIGECRSVGGSAGYALIYLKLD